MKQSSNTPTPRRHFLRQLLVLGGTTAGASALALNSIRVQSAPKAAASVSTDTPASSRGYHLTEHIRTYYDKAQKI